MSGPAALACDEISIMSNGDTPIIWSSDGERLGITEGGDADVVVANRLLATLTGKPLVQFRMGYAMHLEVGDAHEVTIETTFEVVDGNSHWGGEPLTAEAAGALLPLNHREVMSGHIATNGTLALGLGSATLTVPPHPIYEAWQVRGPGGLVIVCSPGGEYVAVWEPEHRT
jgi:hypothetical protein